MYNYYIKLLGYPDVPEFLKKYLTVPSLVRLKGIGYFCGMDYASKDVYDFKCYISRYMHSLSTALLVYKLTSDKTYTLQALFHDVSTPVFSHVIDYMNKDYLYQESTEEFTEFILKNDKVLLRYLEMDNVKVEDLIKGIGIASANDAAVALAEKLGGTVENFVKMMNERAKELGCKNTTFKNPHGLDEDGHLTSAYDMSLMARELVKHEYALKISSTYDEYITVSGENHWLVNTNKLVKFYKGIDGLKTGYTDKAGYCLTATMNKNNMRLISVVMKSSSKDNRSTDTIGMMEYGYSMYGSEVIFKKSEYTGKINISGSENKEYNYYLDNDVKLIVDKNTRDVNYSTKIKLDKLKAPLKKGTKVGELILEFEDKKYTYNLIINEEVKKASYFKVLINNLKDIVTGNRK